MKNDFRKEFADFEGVAYLDTATQGPLPLVSARAAHTALDLKKLPHRIPDKLYFDLPDGVREKIARMIGAHPDEIAITTGASAGMAAVATGLGFEPGDEVIVARGEFPSHFSTWLPYQKAGRLTVRIIAPRGRFLVAEDYIDSIGPKTRLISASLVRFDNGALLDAAKVAEACHAKGVALLLDISQCAGVMPVDIRKLGADFAVGSGYKWLLGPYGTGFFWVAHESEHRLQAGPLYWMALEGARNFNSLPLDNPKAVPGSRRWDSPETASFVNLAQWDAALEMLSRIGLEQVSEHNRALTRILVERLPRDRFVLASPSEPEKRGPSLCVAARNPAETKVLHQKLHEAQIVTALRENSVRISPYLTNTIDDMERVVKVLAVA